MENKSDKDRKQILLRLSPTLWREIAAWAEDDFRSVNGQIEYLLTECVRRRKKAELRDEPDSEASPSPSGESGRESFDSPQFDDIRLRQ